MKNIVEKRLCRYDVIFVTLSIIPFHITSSSIPTSRSGGEEGAEREDLRVEEGERVPGDLLEAPETRGQERARPTEGPRVGRAGQTGAEGARPRHLPELGHRGEEVTRIIGGTETRPHLPTTEDGTGTHTGTRLLMAGTERKRRGPEISGM